MKAGMYPSGVAILAVVFSVVACKNTSQPTPQQATPATSTGRDSQPVLVTEGYLGDFNILRYQDKYYALAKEEGAFSMEKAQNKQYRRFFSGDSVDEVKHQVANTLAVPGVNDSEPLLVEEGYRNNFNLIRYRGKYYALAQDEGAFDVQKFQRKQYKRGFAGNSLEEVRRQVP